MATITSKEVIDNLIALDGFYPGDPQLFLIVEYTNQAGDRVYGITYPHEPDRLRYLTDVANPKILWSQEKSEFIKKHKR